MYVQFLKIVQDYLGANKVRLKQDLFSDDVARRNIVLMYAMTTIVGHILSHVREQNGEQIDIIIDKDRPVVRTQDMPLWLTSRPTYPVDKCPLNVFALDSLWEANEAYSLDTHPSVAAWIKNDHLGFVIWYFYDGSPHRYYPDFVVRLTNGHHVVIETKGQNDVLAQVKRRALQSWIKAVNSTRNWGQWDEILSTHPQDIDEKLRRVVFNHD